VQERLSDSIGAASAINLVAEPRSSAVASPVSVLASLVTVLAQPTNADTDGSNIHEPKCPRAAKRFEIC
jgi:hypothetical protein